MIRIFLAIMAVLSILTISGCDNISVPKANLTTSNTTLNSYCTLIKNSINQFLGSRDYPNDAVNFSEPSKFSEKVKTDKQLVSEVNFDIAKEQNIKCVYQSPQLKKYMKEKKINSMWYRSDNYFKTNS